MSVEEIKGSFIHIFFTMQENRTALLHINQAAHPKYKALDSGILNFIKLNQEFNKNTWPFRMRP